MYRLPRLGDWIRSVGLASAAFASCKRLLPSIQAKAIEMDASIVRRYVLDIERVRRVIRRFVVPASCPTPLPPQRTASAPSNPGTASYGLVETVTDCRFFVQD